MCRLARDSGMPGVENLRLVLFGFGMRKNNKKIKKQFGQTGCGKSDTRPARLCQGCLQQAPKKKDAKKKEGGNVLSVPQ
jgi:hypothetical protein